MRSLKFRLLGAASVAILAGIVVAAEPTLSADLSGKTISADTDHMKKLHDMLTMTKKKGIYPRMKASAVLIALSAQEQLGGKDAAKMAATRDAAMKLVAAVGKKDNAAIGDALKSLESVKADPKASTKPIALKKLIEDSKLDLSELMELFTKSSAGGMNLEDDLKIMKDAKKLAEAAPTPAAMSLLAARTALLADLTSNMPNDKATGAMKKDWESYSADMKKLSLDIAAEAAKAKPDMTKIKTTAGKLDAACTNCHNKFRD